MSDSNYTSKTTEAIQLNVTASDGSRFPVEGIKTTNERNYSITKLNSRLYINNKGDGMDDLFTVQAKVCSSSKDIRMFRELLVATNRDHEFRISAIRFAEKLDATRGTVTKFFKRCVENKLLHKLETNLYLVNPLLFTPVGAYSENIEQAQAKWLGIQLEKDRANPQVSGLLSDAEKLIDKYELTKPVAYLLNNEFFVSILDYYRHGRKLTTRQIDSLVKNFR